MFSDSVFSDSMFLGSFFFRLGFFLAGGFPGRCFMGRRILVPRALLTRGATPDAENFFGITFFGSLVTAPVMMQYHCEACTAGNRLRSNTLTRLILYTYSHNRCGF